jgi:hypothetical protein
MKKPMTGLTNMKNFSPQISVDEMNTNSIGSSLQTKQEETFSRPATRTKHSDLLFADGMALPEFNRLVILIPEFEVDETQFARQIWSIASHQAGASILLVCLANKYQDGLDSQRRLVTLAALTQDLSASIHTSVVNADNWIRGLKGIVKPGDMIVCQAEQQVTMQPIGDQPLANGLIQMFGYPVVALTGLWKPSVQRHSKNALQVFKWLALLLIVGGFFAVEVNIQKLTLGWFSNLLFMVTFILEIGIIWIWFAISNRE